MYIQYKIIGFTSLFPVLSIFGESCLNTRDRWLYLNYNDGLAKPPFELDMNE